MHQVVAVWCLGPVRVTVHGEELRLKPDARALIATLAAAGRAGISHAELHERLYGWGDSALGDVQKTKQRVYRLRRRLTEESRLGLDFITKGDRYGFNPETCFVDTWTFESVGTTDRVVELERALDLWNGTPFDSIDEPHPALDRVSKKLWTQLRDVCDRLAPYTSPTVAARHINRIVQVASIDITNESLVAGAAGALYRLGRQPEALELLSRGRQRLLDRHGLDAGALLGGIESAILTHDSQVLAPVVESSQSLQEMPAPPQPATTAPRRFLARQEAMASIAEFLEPAIDLTGELAAADPPARILLVSGDAGIGKSAIIHELVEAAARSAIGVRLAAVRSVDATDVSEEEAYGPILRALPEVLGAFDQLERQVDAQTRRLRHWEAVVAELAVLGRNERTLLVIEDAHAADTQTNALLRHLAYVTLPANVLVALSARPPSPESDSAWQQTHETLIAAPGVASIDLEPFDNETLRVLVRADHPTEPPMRQSRFADRLEELSGGNPLIATVLSRDAPPGLDPTLLPDTVTPGESLIGHLQSKITDVRLAELLSIAALIGQEFDTLLLAETAGASVAAVMEMLATAAELDVVAPHDGPVWRFDHLLTVNYFTSRLTLLRPLVFARLAKRTSLDSGTAVRYVRGAGDEISADIAIPALLTAGERLASRGAYVEATSAFVHALERLAPDDERRLDLTLELANATARSGALTEARHWRAEAFDLAQASGDPNAMAEAALAGLPDGEFAGGEPDRLALLDRVVISEVTSRPQAQVARLQLRQARTCEEPELVERIYENRNPAWETEDPDGWRAMNFEWLMYRAIADDGPPIHDVLASLADELEPGPFRAEVLHRVLVAALVEQRPDASTTTYELAKQAAAADGTPRTRWSIDVVGATLARVGLRPDAGSLEDARLSGLRWGIPDAFDNWAVQVWVDRWLDDDHASTLSLIRANRTGIAANVAWAAGEALGCAHAGEIERATALADEVALALRTAPGGNWNRIAAALLIEAAAIAGLSDAARAGAESLRGQSGRAIVLGHGSAHFGPVDRYLAIAASVTDDEDPGPLRRAASEQARRAGGGLWADRCDVEAVLR